MPAPSRPFHLLDLRQQPSQLRLGKPDGSASDSGLFWCFRYAIRECATRSQGCVDLGRDVMVELKPNCGIDDLGDALLELCRRCDFHGAHEGTGSRERYFVSDRAFQRGANVYVLIHPRLDERLALDIRVAIEGGHRVAGVERVTSIQVGELVADWFVRGDAEVGVCYRPSARNVVALASCSGRHEKATLAAGIRYSVSEGNARYDILNVWLPQGPYSLRVNDVLMTSQGIGNPRGWSTAAPASPHHVVELKRTSGETTRLDLA